MLTHSELLQLISYDPDTGLFTTLVKIRGRAIGSVSNRNFIDRRGNDYRKTTVCVPGFGNKSAGPLAWFYMTGERPNHEIDHQDNDGWNQRWNNLRPASRSQNQANTRIYKSNSVGRKGVYRCGGSKERPFRAMIQKDSRRISLGRFCTEDEAFAAYVKAANALHGEFARTA